MIKISNVVEYVESNDNRENREEVRGGDNLMIKQDYLLDKSISLNVHKILSIHEKKYQEYLFKHKNYNFTNFKS